MKSTKPNFNLSLPGNSTASLKKSSVGVNSSRPVRPDNLSESVYANENEALSDLNRLLKLNDAEGIKLRVMEIYKEKALLDNYLTEVEDDGEQLRVDVNEKETLLQQYEDAMK